MIFVAAVNAAATRQLHVYPCVFTSSRRKISSVLLGLTLEKLSSSYSSGLCECGLIWFGQHEWKDATPFDSHAARRWAVHRETRRHLFSPSEFCLIQTSREKQGQKHKCRNLGLFRVIYTENTVLQMISTTEPNTFRAEDTFSPAHRCLHLFSPPEEAISKIRLTNVRRIYEVHCEMR